MAQKVLLTTLASGMVLDRSLFVNQNADQMCDTITAISKANKGLLIVDDSSAFFTPDTLISMIANKDGRYRLVNEQIAFFTDAQIKALMGEQNAPPPANNGHGGYGQKPAADGGVIIGKGDAVGPIGYNFAEVPQGWTIGTKMSLGQTKIKRKVKSAQNDGTAFYMSPASYQKLWTHASKIWAGKPQGAMKFDTSEGVRTAAVEVDCIKFGFNVIRRYEIEQVAKYRGWGLPIAA